MSSALYKTSQHLWLFLNEEYHGVASATEVTLNQNTLVPRLSVPCVFTDEHTGMTALPHSRTSYKSTCTHTHNIILFQFGTDINLAVHLLLEIKGMVSFPQDILMTTY